MARVNKLAEQLIVSVPVGSQFCPATSKTTGKQCKQMLKPGQVVCRFHGGSAPQVIRKAKERLAHLIPVADMALGELVQQNKHLPSKIAAVRTVYDRVEGAVNQSVPNQIGVSINIGGGFQPEPVNIIDVDNPNSDDK